MDATEHLRGAAARVKPTSVEVGAKDASDSVPLSATLDAVELEVFAEASTGPARSREARAHQAKPGPGAVCLLCFRCQVQTISREYSKLRCNL